MLCSQHLTSWATKISQSKMPPLVEADLRRKRVGGHMDVAQQTIMNLRSEWSSKSASRVRFVVVFDDALG